ncbi:MAG: MlaD family protein [Gemmatimonadaceae bacterium]
MPRRVRSWRNLAPGLIAIGVVATIALVVLLRARVGTLRGDTYRLYMHVAEARGVMRGTPVWLAGKKVGRVSDIRFRPVTTDTLGRLVIELEVLESHRELLRRDSRADIRTSGTLVGAPVVSLTVGSPAAPVLEPRDTLPAASQLDTEELASRLTIASRALPAILRDVGTLSRQLDTTLLRMDAVGASGDTGLRMLERSAAGIRARMRSGSSTLGLATSDDQLLRRVRRAAARADTMLHALASGPGSIPRFRSDSALLRNMAEIRAEITAVRALLSSPHGTAGRFAADSAIRRQLLRLEWELGETMRDVQKNPARYIELQ